MSPGLTAEGRNFAKELDEICQLPAGPEKERRRKDWAKRLAEHYVRRKPAQRDWQRVASNDPE